MKRILFVESNSLFREGLALLLEWRTGLSSVYAGSLAEAERILKDADQKPACAIVELDLPDGDGTELLKQLDGLPALVLSKKVCSLKRRVQASESGADEVLDMRSPVETIITAVERLICKGPARRVGGKKPHIY